MSAFEPALCTVTFRKLPADEIVALALKARLAAVEWAGDAHIPPGDTSTARTVRRLCDSAGLKTSYGSYVAPPSDDLSAFASALAAAVALGAPNIRIWPGTRQRNSRDYSADERRAAADAIRDMGEEAARHGVTVSLEYHPQTLTDETGSALRLIEAVAHPNVYLYWQPRPGLPLDDAVTEIGRIGEQSPMSMSSPGIATATAFRWRPPPTTGRRLWPPCRHRAGPAGVCHAGIRGGGRSGGVSGRCDGIEAGSSVGASIWRLHDCRRSMPPLPPASGR